jgi:hypothetical protein
MALNQSARHRPCRWDARKIVLCVALMGSIAAATPAQAQTPPDQIPAAARGEEPEETVGDLCNRKHAGGRPLPIHVFGQSPLHDRWGYDHRNAMDVGLNPDSPAGQALVEYLRANGVPFTAFHFAIPGVATGPHIHVGLPSHRITAIVASK